MKPKPQYRRKAKQSTKWANLKTTPSVGKKNVLTSGNGTFSLSNSFEALNVKNLVSEEVETEGECVLVDDDVKPLKNVDYSGDQDSEDEIESVDNEMARLFNVLGDIVNEDQSAFNLPKDKFFGIPMSKRRNWIQIANLLLSVWGGSILVKGSPIGMSFQFYKGLETSANPIILLPLYLADGEPSFIISKDRGSGVTIMGNNVESASGHPKQRPAKL
ncbi:hypothetical protein Tco_0694979 [Tanacetum coccineum]